MTSQTERAGTLVNDRAHLSEAITRRAILITLCLAFWGSLGMPVHAQVKVEFDIAAGPAAQSLNLYAQQAHLQIGFAMDVVDDVRTNAVKGTYESRDALALLLDGTGLKAERGEKGIVIHRVASSQPANDKDLASASAAALHFGQTAPPPAPLDANPTSDGDPADRATPWSGTLEEIVVTGTQIRGTAPVGASLITLDHQYIEASGFATTQEILQSLPQNVGVGANEATSTVGVGPGSFNYGEASSLNLRGLGTASTLPLINGRRSAPGGGRGDFVDLNSIPPTAIERIEVLPDGASAIYGSDAIGGVVNVILRENYDGASTSVHYAPDVNDVEELQFGQVLGAAWQSGHVLGIYDFYDRSDLEAADRDYTRDSDLTRLGGTNHSRPASNPGNINRYTLSDGAHQIVQLAIPRGQDGTNLAPDDLIPGPERQNLQNIREGSTVLPEQRRHSLFVTTTQRLSDRLKLFAESRFSTRDVESRPQQLLTNNLTVPNTNPFFVDPFGGSTALRINYSFADDYGSQRNRSEVDTFGVTAGVAATVGQGWHIETYGSHNREETFSRWDNFPNAALLQLALADPDPATAFNPFGDGSHTNPETLEAIEGFREFDIQSQLSVFNIRANGSLFRTPGGVAKLAVGGEFRDESLRSNQLSFSASLEPVASTSDFDLGRDITAAFSEILLPFVTEQNARPALTQLSLSIAARYEKYSDFGDSLNPKAGLAWSPVTGLNLRSTYGTSFRAPLLFELDDAQSAYQIVTVPDPASATGTTNTLYLFGSNPELQAQEGTTWTAGIDINPPQNRGLELSVTYFDTKVDKLISLPGDQITLPFFQPEIYAEIIERNPDQPRLAELLSSPRCFCGSATPDDVDAIIDFRRQNLAEAKLSGVDVNFAYTAETSIGSIGFSLFGSHLFEFKEQLVNAPMQDTVDTIAKPNSLQLRGALTWSTDRLQASIVGDHTGDYTDDRSATERHISSWTTWDFRLAYGFGSTDSALLNDTSVSLAVRNLFDTSPPFVDLSNGVGFDAMNANAIQRLITVRITKSW